MDDLAAGIGAKVVGVGATVGGVGAAVGGVGTMAAVFCAKSP